MSRSEPCGRAEWDAKRAWFAGRVARGLPGGGGAGERLGETPALTSGVGIDGPVVSDELVELALQNAPLWATVSDMPEGERERLVEGLIEQLGAEREELRERVRDRLVDGMLGELIGGRRTEREILGPDGLWGELTRRLVARAPSEELTEHLGHPAGEAPPGGVGNSRNGTGSPIPGARPSPIRT